MQLVLGYLSVNKKTQKVEIFFLKVRIICQKKSLLNFGHV